MHSHYASEQTSDKLAEQFANDVETMSGGAIDLEICFSKAVMKTVEIFDAAANGALDCDMTGRAYQTTGKNPAFQFVGDPMVGYDTPSQQYA